ncbi:hypothetical protein EUX98_g1627 [Antrodiella citrinella]|uniref:Uncharacterized protein n=1 Tax=Antrodiella citrinella TaxID=2447956 RepID=A0A4S4N111_9APHY|nr:hypothetical protein EUX98_g1627 [Antrodiella citrinella]
MAPTPTYTDRIVLPEDAARGSIPLRVGWVFWLVLFLSLTPGFLYLAIVFIRRHRKQLREAKEVDPEPNQAPRQSKSRLTPRFRSLLARVGIATKTTLVETKKVEDIESKGAVEPSDSSIIRGILSEGTAISWVPYTPSLTSSADDTPSTIENTAIENSTADSEADITDIVGSYLTTTESTPIVAPIVHVVPNTILITLCSTRGEVIDPNFDSPPDSPVIVQHDPAKDYLCVPGPDTTTRGGFSGSRRSVRFSVTGKQMVLASPFMKKKPIGRVGAPRPFMSAGQQGIDSKTVL